MADEPIFEFSGKTTFCHIKKRRKLLLLIALILGQAPRWPFHKSLSSSRAADACKAEGDR
jgi:hypothetical protein